MRYPHKLTCLRVLYGEAELLPYDPGVTVALAEALYKRVERVPGAEGVPPLHPNRDARLAALEVRDLVHGVLNRAERRAVQEWAARSSEPLHEEKKDDE